MPAIRDIKPNPFRDAGHYPISRKKIEYLKTSIRTTGFWDNLIARKVKTFKPVPVPGEPNKQRTFQSEHYELAYGQHRFVALHELVAEQVLDLDFDLDLRVRNLDDAAMVRIMAIEQFNDGMEIFTATVRAVLDFLAKTVKEPVSSLSADDMGQFLMCSGGSDYRRKIQQALSAIRGRND